MTPIAAAIGKLVTLYLHDDRVLHGTLHPLTDASDYVLAQSTGTKRFRRSQVRVVKVWEFIS